MAEFDREFSLAQLLGVRTSFYVISLQGVPGAHPNNAGRLDLFRKHFSDVCGQAVQIEVCPGVLDGRRGYGITRAFVDCLAHAQRRGSDLSFFFEDDARLFSEDSRTPELCDAEFHRSLYARKPRDALVVMLGGHKWKYGQEAPSEGTHSDFKHVVWGLGAYAFAISKQDIPLLRSGWAQDLAQEGFFSPDFQERALSPDVSWYGHAAKRGKRLYAYDPLLVMHLEGWSNTWNQFVDCIDDQKHANNKYDTLHGDNHPAVAISVGEDPLVYRSSTGGRELTLWLHGEEPQCIRVATVEA